MRALWLKHSDAQYSLGVFPHGFMVACCQATLHTEHPDSQKACLQQRQTLPHPTVMNSLLIDFVVGALTFCVSEKIHTDRIHLREMAPAAVILQDLPYSQSL